MCKNSFSSPRYVSFLTLASLAFVSAASAQSKAPGAANGGAGSPPPAGEDLRVAPSDKDESGSMPEKIDVQTMKRRYWTVGNEDLMSVVQNRLYTKKHKWQVGIDGGFYSDDPFISTNTYQLKVGYHFNETWSLHGFYAGMHSSKSTAYLAAKRDTYTPVINPAKSLMGAEVKYSAIYGKLSVLSKSIIYYDLTLTGGLAQIKTNVDSPLAPIFGVGQQIFLSKRFYVNTDYRILYHSEKYDVSPTTPGTRTLWTNWIQLGVGMFF